jgi:enoyl-CoA hydratase
MAARYVSVEQRGDVALVRVDRSPANALDLDLLAEGHAVLRELARAEPGAAVMVGREGFFSAGVDLKLAPTLDRDGQREMVEAINRLITGWYGFPRPLVCAVNGHAIAGGLILALCGDHRVGPTEGRFGLTELKVGVPYPAAAIEVVRAELSPPAARELTLRAHLVGPQRALELGLLDEIHPPEQVLERALSVAEELAALPARAYETVKRQVRGATIARLEEVIAGARDPMLESWLSDETAETAGGVLRRAPVRP